MCERAWREERLKREERWSSLAKWGKEVCCDFASGREGSEEMSELPAILKMRKLKVELDLDDAEGGYAADSHGPPSPRPAGDSQPSSPVRALR
eukprot:CAMPEP_0169474942 /NCGR_PEP_ID=MMETSP1042-20121227/26539_1 /TAXON_ID=464988 /ORGANISM="Hemiselmis andersenii, Strain CCMP1180" /LENGTH=92 /DNA_ID=CAMNT_0009589033 /DNA_START=91 /DNA_END=367 /DNA_ORIENTATION=+